MPAAGRMGVALVCLLAVLGGASGSARAKLSLTFGAYSSDKPSAMVAQIRPSLNELARDMSAILGEEVEILEKPFSPDLLLALVRKLLDRRAAPARVFERERPLERARQA